jgi:hypothetical protein
MIKRGESYPWWRTNYLGWPIVYTTGKPVKNCIRVVVQNIRKIWEAFKAVKL